MQNTQQDGGTLGFWSNWKLMTASISEEQGRGASCEGNSRRQMWVDWGLKDGEEFVVSVVLGDRLKKLFQNELNRKGFCGVTLFVSCCEIRSDNLKDQRIKHALAFDFSMIQSQIRFNSKQHTKLQ